jgi:DNA excision repair protein ERCC-5
MGVKGLWKLLQPVATRLSLETLATRRLAIDASIWLTQFVKAMRDKEGALSKNAHILVSAGFDNILKELFSD